ncbi:MAG: hypothetical protein Q9181_003057 [Wetmoreana brouardii]
MQIANILSDLTSLRVCDYSAALALVSTRAPASDNSGTEASEHHRLSDSQDGKDNPDMQRAMDLMELHHGVKLKHIRGEDQGLMQARRDVDAVLAKLERPVSEGGK